MIFAKQIINNLDLHKHFPWGFPGNSDSKESACSVEGPWFAPWVGKIPWRRAWQPHCSVLAWRVVNGGMGQTGWKTLPKSILSIHHYFATQQTFSSSFSLVA